MTRALLIGVCLFALAPVASAQSPAASATLTIGGKAISIRYSAPSVRGRKVFAAGGPISRDPTYPVWRAGANDATALSTDVNLDIGGLAVPKGSYTLYVLVKDPNAWELIVNKETGQWGDTYNASRDLGRVKMTTSTPAAPVETLKYTLTDTGGGKVELRLAWENRVATVQMTVR
ncbi:MAG: DUF2911 domain-containing protein [Vicinamibacterales bacterium]|nr:DUF2911 domain-containing protein [Vicinamibacterales bacterium]